MLSVQSASLELQLQVHLAEQAFVQRHGHFADVVVAAPGRVNLIGEHVDYNDGFVLPMAIERYVVIAASRRNARIDPVEDRSQPIADSTIGTHHEVDSGRAEIYSLQLNRGVSIDLKHPIPPDQGKDAWSNYVRGVISGVQQKQVVVPGFKAVISSSIPLGGGLSSSAAIEVATATLLEVLTDLKISKMQKSLLCQQAEHDFAQVPCGLMDQFSSVFGERDRLMLIDCQAKTLQMIQLGKSPAKDNPVIMIVNSNVKHELSGGEYADRRRQCDAALQRLSLSSYRQLCMPDLAAKHQLLTDVQYRRARHVITETQRTLLTAKALSESDWMTAGRLMYESHDSLRNDFEVSCPELDGLVDIVRGLGMEHGVWGSRMTGGGFGGCTVSLVQAEKVEAVMEIVERQYAQKFGRKADAFTSCPAAGASVIRG